MALPSQMARNTDHRSHMYRRRRAKRGPVVAGLLSVAVLVALIWGWMNWGSDADGALGEPLAADALVKPFDEPGKDAAINKAHAPAHAGKPAEESLPRVVMGAGHSPSGATTKPSAPRPLATSTPTLDLKAASSPTIGSQDPKPVPSPAAPPPAATAAKAAGNDLASPAAGPAQRELERGLDLMKSGKLIEARRTLTAAHDSPSLSPAAAQQARAALAQINQHLIFSPEVLPTDPFAFTYVVKEGDALEKIVANQNIRVDWRFIQSINRIARPESIQPGQKVKLIRGPFHAVVHKDAYRLDAYLGEGTQPVLIASFPVGLGEFDSTPPGRYRVKRHSKLIDPQWRNPRTGEHFASGDPKNPLGGYWIGIEGIDEANQDLKSYGLHGTIEPETIGKQKSMGCIRLLPEDVKLLYQMLVEEQSTVEIVDR